MSGQITIPKILYHGTTKEYVERALTKYEKYMNCENEAMDIWLSDELNEAVVWAGVYGKQNEATPVILIVDSSKITSEIRYKRCFFKCRYLDTDSFHMLELNLNLERDYGKLFFEPETDSITDIVRKIEQGEK